MTSETASAAELDEIIAALRAGHTVQLGGQQSSDNLGYRDGGFVSDWRDNGNTGTDEVTEAQVRARLQGWSRPTIERILATVRAPRT